MTSTRSFANPWNIMPILSLSWQIRNSNSNMQHVNKKQMNRTGLAMAQLKAISDFRCIVMSVRRRNLKRCAHNSAKRDSSVVVIGTVKPRSISLIIVQLYYFKQ